MSNSTTNQLIAAARRGQMVRVRELSTNATTEALGEALVASCKNGHIDIVKWIVTNSQADINYRGWKPNFTLMTAASRYGHISLIRWLVRHRRRAINWRQQDRSGRTLLTTACPYVQMALSKYLLRYIPDDLAVTLVDWRGNTSLHYAIWNIRYDRTPLHIACDRGDKNEVSRCIASCPEKVDVQDNYGNTALHIACCRGHLHIVSILMASSADETITNFDKKTPLQLAQSFEM